MPDPHYRLAFDPVLKRQVAALPGKLRQEAMQRIAALANDPRPPQARALRGAPHIYRCWLSDARYRLIWAVDDTAMLVEIYYVGRKPDYGAFIGETEPVEDP